MTITPAIRELVDSGPLAHVTTLNSDGSPQVSVVWVGIDGKARITEGGAAELLQRLARIYLGPDVEFPPESLRSKPGFIAHITPERYAGIGPWQPRQR